MKISASRWSFLGQGSFPSLKSADQLEDHVIKSLLSLPKDGCLVKPLPIWPWHKSVMKSFSNAESIHIQCPIYAVNH